MNDFKTILKYIFLIVLLYCLGMAIYVWTMEESHMYNGFDILSISFIVGSVLLLFVSLLLLYFIFSLLNLILILLFKI